MKFVVTIEMAKAGEFPNYWEAFQMFWTRMMEILKKGKGTSWQTFETASWISVVFEEYGLDIPIFIYDARDLAFNCGLLQKNEAGENLEPRLCPPPTTELKKTVYEAKLALDLHELLVKLAGEYSAKITEVFEHVSQIMTEGAQEESNPAAD